ncbi:DMT family transporter [Actinomycetospora atypica]|uniref:DMT family transporter n=1 Tax=Actinomycetospora atypica TaxID=1290095 RepID=A0ABV9YQK8_9PSEU
MRKQALTAWLFLVGAILLEVTATLSMKAALEVPALYALVAVGYLGSFACLTMVLRAGMALGVAYGIWGAAGVALTALLSTLLFSEPLTALMGVGIVLVIGGVLCVELGTHVKHENKAVA